MIQINLLPPEYRPRQGTPVARFIAIVAGVVVIACAGGAYAYTHFVELAKVKEMRSSREDFSRSSAPRTRVSVVRMGIHRCGSAKRCFRSSR